MTVVRFTCLALSVVALASGASVRSLVNEGNAAYEVEDYDGALEAYNQAAEADPNSPQASFNRGAALYRKGRFDEAIPAYTAAAENARAEEDGALEAAARYNLGNAFVRRAEESRSSDPQTAVQSLQNAIRAYRGAAQTVDGFPDAAHNLEIAKRTLKEILDEMRNQPQGGSNQQQEQQDQGEDLADRLRENIEQQQELSQEREELEQESQEQQQTPQQRQRQQQQSQDLADRQRELEQESREMSDEVSMIASARRASVAPSRARAKMRSRYADGSTATVDRVQVESLTELIMGHEQYRVMSFTDPSESRVRTRVTRNLIVSEIVKHAAPEPVDPKIFALVRDEQFEQITFNLIDQDLETDRPGSRAREIIREMGPYVDLLASTLALSGDLPALPVLAGETTILVDSTIGRWDIETLDVIDIALREG